MSNGAAAAEEGRNIPLVRNLTERPSREGGALQGQNLIPELARPFEIEPRTQLDWKVLRDFAEHFHREQCDHDVRGFWICAPMTLITLG